MPDMGMENSDKLGHFLAYGVLMAWFAQIYLHLKIRALLALTFITMGIVIEYVQGMTEYRSFQYADMLADGFGVLLALAITQGPLARLLLGFEKQFIR